MTNFPSNIVCFSHLRWDFVYQRPQHLLTRFSKQFNVHFIEEPIFDAPGDAYLSFEKRGEKLSVGTPHLPKGLGDDQINGLLDQLLKKFFLGKDLSHFVFWYYTPMALKFTEYYQPRLVVYDCMDELSGFKFAPPELASLEKKLFDWADVVFTGGHALYCAKKNKHENIHPFPSSIEMEHFMKARRKQKEPIDQSTISGIKIGFYGVLDERLDLELIDSISRQRSDWELVLVGPVVKIDPATLPQRANIHYLGVKEYKKLPAYLSGWDVAILPFQLNEATRFISPTKTPEFLAAGRPVVSTAITDVINPYGERRLVEIANNAKEFIAAIDELLHRQKKDWLTQVDRFLAGTSWDDTQQRMFNIMKATLKKKEALAA